MLLYGLNMLVMNELTTKADSLFFLQRGRVESHSDLIKAAASQDESCLPRQQSQNQRKAWSRTLAPENAVRISHQDKRNSGWKWDVWCRCRHSWTSMFLAVCSCTALSEISPATKIPRHQKTAEPAAAHSPEYHISQQRCTCSPVPPSPAWRALFASPFSITLLHYICCFWEQRQLVPTLGAAAGALLCQTTTLLCSSAEQINQLKTLYFYCT